MLINVKGFGHECGFPQEAVDALVQAEAALPEKAGKLLQDCRTRLFEGDTTVWNEINALAEQAGLHRFVMHQLFLIFCTEETRVRYDKAGLPDWLYRDSVKDLRYKMEETHQIYGVWGVLCGPWLAGLLVLKCFCLGRLQFEIIPADYGCELDGHTLKPGDPVINLHIPSHGRLDYAAVLEAYGKAAEFFGHLFPDGVIWFHVQTWILYPPVTAVLPQGNLKRFAEDFTILHAWVDPAQDDRFRVFQLPAGVPMETYPENSSLQRNLKQWLLAGNTMGVGFGVFLWKDGQMVKPV